MKSAWLGLLAGVAAAGLLSAQAAVPPDGAWVLDNGVVRLTVEARAGRLTGDRMERADGAGPSLRSDGGFALELTWSDWSAPGKKQNADNPVLLTPADFLLEKAEAEETAAGRQLTLRFRGDGQAGNPLRLALVYRLDSGRFWVQRRLEVSDPGGPRHFLRLLRPLQLALGAGFSPLKGGGFGQPVALTADSAGAFFAVEYPAADNLLETGGGVLRVRAGQEIGKRVGPEPIASDWVVQALTPDARVKRWFFEYLDSVRVAPLRPYTLYNSWYDLRSPVYPKVTPEHVMNEANVRRIIGLLRANMIEKHGIRLDAVVLDDGWDVYASDWALRRDQFPGGLKPIADELARTGTRLGIWFGPTGGYSFRKERLGWMKEHGYETVGDQLCLAGSTYRALFEKRVLDFVRGDRAGYFKWDGIQFACSEPGHGHAVDIYSRRAVMEAVAGLCRAARAADPEMFLNVTSGTWLSPWWLRFADQIWMGGEDYGWADVPSLSPRDAAITYRDSVLYDDFRAQDLWFPIANLMTHGIIKGRLQMLGGEEEPLEKFADETVMYVARGVSMYEMYVSPDLLSEGEWTAMAGALRWARDRFPLLRHTEMVGGDPRRGEAYGYVHADGSRAIVAVRNPRMEPQALRLPLAEVDGMGRDSSGLVLERVYPTRWIDPLLHAAGDTLELPLDGFTTAVYEIYPLAEARRPLPAGVEFVGRVNGDGSYVVTLPAGAPEPRWLNDAAWPAPAPAPACAAPTPRLGTARIVRSGSGFLELDLEVASGVRQAEVAVLLRPDVAGALDAPLPAVRLDGRPAKPRVESQPKSWSWIALDLAPGRHRVRLSMPRAGTTAWLGTARAWLVGRVVRPARENVLRGSAAAEEPPLLPSPWPAGEHRRQEFAGEARLAQAGDGF